MYYMQIGLAEALIAEVNNLLAVLHHQMLGENDVAARALERARFAFSTRAQQNKNKCKQ